MGHTIFILGTDPQQCNELREILQERVAHNIVTTFENEMSKIHQSDTLIVASEEKTSDVVYRRLVSKLQEQVHRVELLSQLIRLFSSSLQIDELLQGVVSKSTEVLGDTSFIVLAGEAGLRLEAAFSKDRERLVKLLIATVNFREQVLKGDLLTPILVHRESVVLPSLPHANLTAEMRDIVEKHEVTSLLAVPIQTKDAVLGAFVSLATEPKMFTDEDVATASALADFTAIALENAGLFAEVQRSAITDSLTGVYNTRFFHEVLGRETARADRYSTPLSLLMVDIDLFKKVNDSFGHIVGNKVLTEIARALAHTVRNTDFVFRCGGDEFAVILPGTDRDGAMHVAEKILRRVETAEILTTLGYAGQVTVSIGLSDYVHGSHFETLVAEADQALYTSKRSSRNCAKAFKG